MTEAQEIISKLGTLSYGGVFVLSLLANVVIPVPGRSGHCLLLAMPHAAAGLSLVLIIPIVMIGLLVSDLVLYYFFPKRK